MLLEIEEFNDFLAELVKDETIRIAVLEQRNEGMVATKIVYTTKRPDHVIRCLEEFAPYQENNAEAKASFSKVLEDRRTSLATKGVGFTKGMWSI